MNKLATLLLFLAFPLIIAARPMRSWTYQEMFDQADLVLIAKPLSTKDTTETAKVMSSDVVGLSTEFEIRTVMKGRDKTLGKLTLHHYRLAKADSPIVNGPNLVAFDPAKPHCFLLGWPMPPAINHHPLPHSPLCGPCLSAICRSAVARLLKHTFLLLHRVRNSSNRLSQ